MSSTKLTLPASAQRVLAIATAGALLPLGLAGAASAQTTTPAPAPVDITKNACAGTVPDAGYTDISGVDATNKTAINCISGYGIAKGTTATLYNPTGVVNRSQMALFLTRLATVANVTLDSKDAGFTDIAGETAVAQTAINQLANLGVAKGKTATSYAPGEGVSRAQMASFLNRLQAVIEKKTPTSAGSFSTAAGTKDYYTDDNGSVAEADINAITAGGIATGTGGTNFSPSNGVSRAQMALFIARDLEVNVVAKNITSKYPAAQVLDTLAVTPTAAATLALLNDNTAATGAGADDPADNRSFTVTGLNNALTYRITLVDSQNVKGDAGNRTFKSSLITGTTNKYAVDTGANIADILNVNNGVNALAGTNEVAGVDTVTTKPVNGAITFTIDGTAPGTVVPAVYIDGGQGGTATTGGASNRLETSATKAGDFAAASETFGLGGPTTFTAQQAPNGAITGATVSTVTKGTNMFTTGTGSGTLSYTFDANDTFNVTTPVARGGSGNPQSVGQTAFLAALSTGDGITGTYTRDPAGASVFNLVNTNPTNPAAPTATQQTGTKSRDIVVTGTIPALESADTITVQRAPVTGFVPASTTPPVTRVEGTPGTFATIATVPATDTDAVTAGIQYSYTDANVPTGNYAYRVIVTTDGDASNPSPASATVSSSDVAANPAPFSNDARVSTDTGFTNQANSGDVFTISFNKAIVAPAAGATLRIQDADGTLVDVIAGTNATFTLNGTAINQNGAARAAGTVLTVTLTADPTVVTAGTIVGLQYAPNTNIVNTAGIVDASGQSYNLGSSTDRGLDVAANTTFTPAV